MGSDNKRDGDLGRSSELLSFFKMAAKSGAENSPHRCFCGQLATMKLGYLTYYYCDHHALDTTKVYRRWLQMGGRSRFVRA